MGWCSGTLLCPASFTLHVGDLSVLLHVLVVCPILFLNNSTLNNYHNLLISLPVDGLLDFLQSFE